MIGELPAILDPGGGAAAALLARLARASVAGGLFVAAVWCLFRALPRLPAGWRSALWWTACLKLVLVLVWLAPVELALLPPPEAPSAREAAARLPWSSRPVAAVETPTAAAAVHAPIARPGPPSAGLAQSFPWREALAILWLLGVSAGGARIGRELAAVRRLRRESRPAVDPKLLAAFAALRERLGVRGPVELRLADGIASPLTIGLLRPAVVLPARAPRELPAAELSLALAHELLHVRRRDLWAGWVPELARRLFFFHPLAALAAREYRLAREAACDAAVVQQLGADPRSYGRLLLRWGATAGSRGATGGALAEAFPGGLPGVGAAAAASPSYRDLKRRLVMLQTATSTSRSFRILAWAAALCAVAALVPLRIVAEPPAPPEPPAAPEAPDPRPARLATLAPAAPGAPKAPATPEPPAAPAPPPKAHGYAFGWTGEGEAWALVEGDAQISMSGSYRNLSRARELHRESGEPILWFGRDGKEYVVRDPETIARAKAILEPQRELGRQQGELGRQQAELGRQQAELGRRQGELGREQGELGKQQGELGARQGELGARQARLAAEQAALAAEHAALLARRLADRGAGESAEDRARRAELETRRDELSARIRELGERQRELGERQRELGVPQTELGRQQAGLGVPQAELGRRQAELGARQEALGERQREAAERAEPLLRELFDRAIERGLAEPVDQAR